MPQYEEITLSSLRAFGKAVRDSIWQRQAWDESLTKYRHDAPASEFRTTLAYAGCLHEFTCRVPKTRGIPLPPFPC
jgi:hypothetical protein